MDFMDFEDEEEIEDDISAKEGFFKQVVSREKKSDDFELDTYFNISSDDESTLFKRSHMKRCNSKTTAD